MRRHMKIIGNHMFKRIVDPRHDGRHDHARHILTTIPHRRNQFAHENAVLVRSFDKIGRKPKTGLQFALFKKAGFDVCVADVKGKKHLSSSAFQLIYLYFKSTQGAHYLRLASRARMDATTGRRTRSSTTTITTAPAASKSPLEMHTPQIAAPTADTSMPLAAAYCGA